MKFRSNYFITFIFNSKWYTVILILGILIAINTVYIQPAINTAK